VALSGEELIDFDRQRPGLDICEYSTDMFHSVHLDFLKGPTDDVRCANSRLKPFINLGDDLESFYWVLVWIVLQHVSTSHDHPADDVALASRYLFRTSLRPWLSRRTKRFWLQSHSAVGVLQHGSSLTGLLEEFRGLCAAAVVQFGDRIPLSHQSVVASFASALGDPDLLPSRNGAPPYPPGKVNSQF
jgi:hypothetical protein